MILFSKIGTSWKQPRSGSVVVSQADPHSWISQKDYILIRHLDFWDPFRNI